MSVRDFWNRTQVYFGIKEEDWDDDYFEKLRKRTRSRK